MAEKEVYSTSFRGIRHCVSRLRAFATLAWNRFLLCKNGSYHRFATKKGHPDGCPLSGGERVLAVTAFPWLPVERHYIARTLFCGNREPIFATQKWFTPAPPKKGTTKVPILWRRERALIQTPIIIKSGVFHKF